VGFDLVGCIKRNSHDNQQSRAPEVKGHIELVDKYLRQDADGRNIYGTSKGNPRKNPVNVFSSVPPGSDAGNKSAIPLDIVCHVNRIKMNRRVKIAEEKYKNDINKAMYSVPRG